MKNKKRMERIQESMSKTFKEWTSRSAVSIVIDVVTLILSIIAAILLFIKYGFVNGFLLSVVVIVFFVSWNIVIKKLKFAEPSGTITEAEPVAYVKPKEIKEPDYQVAPESKSLSLNDDVIASVTEQKETITDKAIKIGNAVVDTKNALKSVFIKSRVSLDEFTRAVIKKGTNVSSLIGEPIFSNPEIDSLCVMNPKLDNGIYSGAFELGEVQKVPYYGYSSVMLKLLPGEMFNYFDSSVRWTGIPFNTNFITQVDKKSNALATLEDKLARMSIWLKNSKDIYVLQISFIASNVSNTNSFKEIKKFLLTTLLGTVGQTANDTYIECGLCSISDGILEASRNAIAGLDKSVIQGKCDFSIPDVLLGIQGTEANTMDTPSNMDYLIKDVNGVELKRCVNSSTTEYTMFTYSLDSMRAKRFFTAVDTAVILNTTVFKPSLVKDMMKWVLGQYLVIPDCIAFDISTGVGSDTIHVISSVNGITLDSFKTLDDSYLSGLFRMNSVSAYSGTVKPTDIRVVIHSTGRLIEGVELNPELIEEK